MKCLEIETCRNANGSCERLGPEHSCGYYESSASPSGYDSLEKTTMTQLADVVPTEFYRGDEEKPSANTVGEMIEILKRLPPDLPFGDEHEVTVFNIRMADAHAKIEEVW